MKVKHFIEEKFLMFEFDEEIDEYTSGKIRKRTDYEIQRLMPKKVIFDFKNVGFMDSAGIGLILGRYKNINSYGGNLELINVKDSVKRIFEMSGMKKFIKEDKVS